MTVWRVSYTSSEEAHGPLLGVKHHFVPDGMFENIRNAREAAVVVDAVLEHMRSHPDESLGVVTLNFEQRELVRSCSDRRLSLANSKTRKVVCFPASGIDSPRSCAFASVRSTNAADRR